MPWEVMQRATVLPLDKMTTAEKLRLIEDIWADLSRQPENIPSPSWHEEVLMGREDKVKEGAAVFSDWAEAKQRILGSTCMR